MKKLIQIICALGVSIPAAAFAKDSFPGSIAQHLALNYTPECNLCHASTAGGGSVVQPFGLSMLAAGLNSSGGNSLTAALDKLKADGTDSDGDGTPDIAELTAGTSPNPDKTPIEYGCGGQIAPHGTTGWQATALGLIAFIFFAKRAGRTRSGNLS